MSFYYKYNFVSPEPTYAIIQEELKSYFDTGAIDTLLWPTYTDKCLKKLGRSSYIITEDILYIEDFKSRLPDNFYAVREAWLCTSVEGNSVQEASSFYSQAALQTTIQISPIITDCVNPQCTNDPCNGQCMPELIQTVYKTNNSFNTSYKRQYLLKPGNISVKSNCSLDCANFGSSSLDSFDIRDNKFVTNFRNGIVYLVMYATDYDEIGNQLIPDNYRVKEYIEAFIKYKVFETLSNQINDETFNQIQGKMVQYKQMVDEAYIMADIETKKQTAYQKINRIKQNLNRLNMYELPTSNGWRRN